tara:strand:+ start:2141 stop:2425 length:285 start_codon:yes stop_codon:yes gene_type:complete
MGVTMSIQRPRLTVKVIEASLLDFAVRMIESGSAVPDNTTFHNFKSIGEMAYNESFLKVLNRYSSQTELGKDAFTTEDILQIEKDEKERMDSRY